MRRVEFCCWVEAAVPGRPAGVLLRLASLALLALVPAALLTGASLTLAGAVFAVSLAVSLGLRANGMRGGTERVMARATLEVDGGTATLTLPPSVGREAKGKAVVDPAGDLIVGDLRVTPASREALEAVRRLLEEGEAL